MMVNMHVPENTNFASAALPRQHALMISLIKNKLHLFSPLILRKTFFFFLLYFSVLRSFPLPVMNDNIFNKIISQTWTTLKAYEAILTHFLNHKS